MDGMNIRTDIHQVQKSMGYCPQFDALIDQMTGEEMLYMYARLRGVPEPNIPGIVDDLLTSLLLNKHRKKKTKEYRYVCGLEIFKDRVKEADST